MDKLKKLFAPVVPALAAFIIASCNTTIDPSGGNISNAASNNSKNAQTDLQFLSMKELQTQIHNKKVNVDPKILEEYVRRVISKVESPVTILSLGSTGSVSSFSSYNDGYFFNMLFTISSVNHTNWYATATFYHSDGREIPSINVAYQESFDLGYFAGNEPNHWASPIGSILVQYGYGVYWCSLTIYNSAGGTWNSGNFGHFVGY